MEPCTYMSIIGPFTDVKPTLVDLQDDDTSRPETPTLSWSFPPLNLDSRGCRSSRILPAWEAGGVLVVFVVLPSTLPW